MTDGALALRLQPDVIAAAHGDQRAFGRLVDVTRGVVSSIALAILRDADESTDVAQDVYMAAWTGLRKLREPSSFLPWLRQLTRNRAHHVLRTGIRRRRRTSDDRADDLLAAAADPRPNAIEELVAAEERSALAQAIDELPAGSREVVVLYYREGRSAAQVAELLDMSEDAVKQRLSRARTRLRDTLLRQVSETAPTAAFTATVLTAISLAAPPVSAAATIGASKVAIGGKLAAKLGVPLALSGAVAGAVAGLAGGVAGIAFGARRLLRLARDDEERRGVLHMSSVTLLGMLMFMTVVLWWPRPLPVTIAFAGLAATFGVCHFVWLPRITRRRYDAELRENPVAAAREHRMRRQQAIRGCALGLTLGGAAVLASWFF